MNDRINRIISGPPEPEQRRTLLQSDFDWLIACAKLVEEAVPIVDRVREELFDQSGGPSQEDARRVYQRANIWASSAKDCGFKVLDLAQPIHKEAKK